MLRSWLVILIIGLMSASALAAPQHPFIKIDAPPAAVAQAVQDVPPGELEPVSSPLVYVVPDRRFDAGYWIATSAYAFSALADIITTKHALDRGGIETNRWWARNNGRSVSYAGYIGSTAIQILIFTLAEKKGPRWLRALARIQIIVSTGQRINAACNNHQVNR